MSNPTELQALSPDQFDAVCDAQDEDSTLAGLSVQDVAAELAKRGDERFEGWGQAPVEEAAPAAAPAAAAPAAPAPPSKPKPAPAEPVLEEEAAPPVLNAGAPKELHEAAPAAVLPPAKPTAEAKQLPAKPPEPETALDKNRGEAVEGMEFCDSRDLVIPNLQLKQAQTRDDDDSGIDEIEDGHWFLSNDPEGNSEARELVFLEVRPGRTYMLPYEDDDARDEVLAEFGLDGKVPDDVKVICSSLDRVTPTAPEEWDALAESCSDCPHSKWRKTSRGRKPPACGEVYRTIVVDTTEGDVPARLFLKSSAIRPTQSLLTNLQLAARRKKLPICGFSVSVSSVKKKATKGNYFIPKFGRPQPLDAEDVEAYRGLRQELLQGEG